MKKGLTRQELEKITKILKGFSDIEQAVMFGSRAKGNHKKGSDIDLALKGEAISAATIKRLSSILNEEVPLPYFFDVVHYESISHAELVQHIDRFGKIVYKR